MINSKSIISRLIFVVGISVCMIANSEVIRTSKESFLVEYQDGGKEKFLAKYTAHASSSRHQTGEHSSWKHPIDTRQCHWSYEAYIKREVCLQARSGQEFCEGKLNKVFQINQSAQGKHFNWSNLQGDNCGKMAGTIDAGYNNIKAVLINEFQKVTLTDIPAVKSSLLKENTVISVKLWGER